MYFNVSVVITTVFLVLNAYSCSGVFDWLFGTEDEQAKDVPFKKSGIRFEVLSTDEKFLDFAKTLTDLTPLDACYQLVCSSLVVNVPDSHMPHQYLNIFQSKYSSYLHFHYVTFYKR